MNGIYVKCVVAGILFGIWPLLMNRSKISGNIAAAVFSFVGLMCILPFAINGINKTLLGANWALAITAGIMGGFGLLLYNMMIAAATSERVGTLMIINLLLQIVTPAIYTVVVSRSLPLTKGIGFIAAVAAALLLTS